MSFMSKFLRGAPIKREISIAAMTRKVQDIRARSHGARLSLLSVDVAPRFVAIAPTTPTA